ncbi:MAG: LysM peptidoglycan-binding domain-containing protein [Desulfosarcinaceae bacterium]|nr:LysM peptidoglycan-binding domain-containing protein [Desulfosarcinaceae bacterium]
MKWRDSDDPTSVSEPAVEKGFDGDPNAEWNEAAELNTAKRNFAAGVTRSSSVWVVIAVAVLGLIIILILPRVQPSGGEEQLLALETRIEALEQQLAKFDSVDENVSRIWEQAKSFEQFKERFERTDASTSLRMDHLATSLSAVQKRVEKLEKSRAATVAPRPTESTAKTSATASSGAVQPAKPTASKAATPATFHTIVKGDTLYSVGRKYGLKVDELLRINNLPADTVIKPGQRLRVTP